MALLQKVKDVYRALPPWVTAPVKYVPDGLLFGKSFRTCVPRTDLACLGPNLKAALDYAREHTVWGRENIPSQIAAEDASAIVKSLPIVTSADVQRDPSAFISDEANDINSYLTTTGETGRNPTTVRLGNASYGVEWRHMLEIWMAGRGQKGYCRQKDVKLTFRGYHFKPGELVRFDPIYNELGVDPFQLKEDTFGQFLGLIRKWRITCLHGYPSLIALFMERLKARGETFAVKSIFLASEGCAMEKKREMAEFFGAKVIAWYGLTEKVVLAFDTETLGRFVNFTSYGFPWIANPDKDGVGEIIGTTFVNCAMPLVNYATGDYGRVIECEDRLVIENLQGRSGKDFLYDQKGNRFPATGINLPAEIQEKIVFSQVTQNNFGAVKITYLPKVECNLQSSQIADEIKCHFLKLLPQFDIEAVAVSDESCFLRSKRGKFMMLVQNLKPEQPIRTAAGKLKLKV